MTGKQGSQANLAVDVVAETTPPPGPLLNPPHLFCRYDGVFRAYAPAPTFKAPGGGLFGSTCNFLQVRRAVQSAFGMVELSCGLSYHTF